MSSYRLAYKYVNWLAETAVDRKWIAVVPRNMVPVAFIDWKLRMIPVIIVVDENLGSVHKKDIGDTHDQSGLVVALSIGK